VTLRPPRLLVLLALALVAGACAPRVPVPVLAPPPPALPPVPFHDGPLVLDLVYPFADGEVTVRDRTFVFGATGTGRARLTVNGTPVAVEPNGAFLAFLPVPPDGVYRVTATAGDEHATLSRRVGVPPPLPTVVPREALIVDGSVFPRGAWAALPGERIEVGFRGAAGGQAALVLPDGTRLPLVERGPAIEVPGGRRVFGATPPEAEPAAPGLADYRGFFTARALRAADPAIPMPALGGPPPLDVEGRGAVVELAVGDSVVGVPLPLNLAVLDPERPAVGVAFEPEPYPRSAGGVDAGAGPGATHHWFWDNGTELTLTGERAGHLRVRLAPDLHAWVRADQVWIAAPGTPPPLGRIGAVRLVPGADAIDVRVEVDRRLPYRVDARPRALEITLYGGVGDTRWLMLGGLDDHVVGGGWRQAADGVWVLALDLAAPPWGHAAFWDANGDLVVRVRRPPPLDHRRPLEGLIVAVDPGHPPGGAIGPTRLTEAEVVLVVARRLQRLLERAGARVVLTRTDDRPVGLYERTGIAEASGAHLFVSIHQNAFPDGVDPFAHSGTSTFYFHPPAAPLARALQAELLAEFGLRDVGVGHASLAVVRRLTWMPAALTETMFMMVPRQEAALRDPDVLERIAAAHFRALERFVRDRASRR
jgi:N-acetylmuramoyl-L-alanine amidase